MSGILEIWSGKVGKKSGILELGTSRHPVKIRAACLHNLPGLDDFLSMDAQRDESSMVSNIIETPIHTTKLGEERGCESQVQTQLENSCSMTKSLDQGHSGESMEVSTHELSRDQESCENRYKSQDENEECSDNNYYQYPFEIIMLEPETVVKGEEEEEKEEEDHVVIVEGGLHEEKGERRLKNDDNLKKDNMEGTELESDEENYSPTKMMQDEYITPDINTAIDDLESANKSTVLITKYASEKRIGEQKSSKCGNSSLGKSLLTHKSHVKGTKSRKILYNCEFCNTTFNNKSTLERHLRSHTGDRPYKCEFCNKSFTQKSTLTTHSRVHTGKPFKCHVCDSSFIKKSHLNNHLQTHTGERPFKCEYCNKSFFDKSNLNQHLLIHTGDRLYSCEFCDRTFTQKSTLTTHLHTHTGKPFKCEFCDKSFITKSHLACHLNTHTGERPYKCEFCDKSYNGRSNLNRHLIIHTGERPYGCEFCDKTYNDKSHLTRHLKTHST